MRFRERPAERPVVLAFTAFKGTLSPLEACRAARRAFDAPELLPVADGGDGTLEVFDGTTRSARVTGPLGNAVTARYKLDGTTAVIEMAEASGLRLVPPARRNPLVTTSRGTGELIVAARRAGATRILLGAGGSATVDAGREALEVLDHARDVVVLCDVRTRLLDAPRLFGPQKGATRAMMRELESRMRALPRSVWRLEGSGAAGGLAGGLASAGARLVRGGEFILRELRFRARTRQAGLIVTGEGRFDRTSLQGKATGEVLRQSRAPVAVLCGSSDLTARQAGAWRIVELREVDPDPVGHPARALRAAAAQVRDAMRR
jgi:glycerate kinase